MMQKSKITVSPLKELFINSSGKRNLSIKLQKMDASDAVPDFPILSESYLRSLTFGVYQVKETFSFACEHLDEDGGYDIFVGKTMPNIFRVKYSLDMCQQKAIIFGFNLIQRTKTIRSSSGTASVSRGLV